MRSTPGMLGDLLDEGSVERLIKILGPVIAVLSISMMAFAA